MEDVCWISAGDSRGAGRDRQGSRGSMKIFVDGGIRSGVDVFKALALGADAVIIARPFVTAVYGGAEEGVKSYIDKIGTELEDTMKMCGVTSLKEITRASVWMK